MHFTKKRPLPGYYFAQIPVLSPQIGKKKPCKLAQSESYHLVLYIEQNAMN
jgi:hypothetical protein